MCKKLHLFAVFTALLAALGLGKNSLADPPVSLTVDITGETISNPCDPSGSSDVTATSGTAEESFHTVNLPDGSQNLHAKITVRGEGTDSNGNIYEFGANEEEQANFGDDVLARIVAVIRVHSKTGTSFISILRLADLNNHQVDHQKNVCIGND